MPTRTFKTLAKRTGKSVDRLAVYWKRAKRSYNRAQSRAKQGKREPVRDKHSYMMATVMRQVQKTGSNPHTPMADVRKKNKKKKKKDRPSKKEGFISRIDSILETILI